MSQLTHNKSHVKLIVLILLIVSVFTIAVLYFGIIKPGQARPTYKLAALKIDGTILPKATPIADFHFTDQNNSPFTHKSLRGKWTFLFFGFTNCGYVCPTTLTELNKMYKTLQNELPNNKLPQIVLVSVDPERDTVARMHEYIIAFNSKFMGVRANLATTEKFEKELHITAVKMHPEGQPKDHYMVNHTAEILLLNPEGKIQAYLSYPHKAQQMARDYKLIINSLG